MHLEFTKIIYVKFNFKFCIKIKIYIIETLLPWSIKMDNFENSSDGDQEFNNRAMEDLNLEELNVNITL